jgi:hypothetical protein
MLKALASAYKSDSAFKLGLSIALALLALLVALHL